VPLRNRRSCSPFDDHGVTVACGEVRQFGDAERRNIAVPRYLPCSRHPAVDEQESRSGDAEPAIGVVDDARAVVEAKHGVVERGQESRWHRNVGWREQPVRGVEQFASAPITECTQPRA